MTRRTLLLSLLVCLIGSIAFAQTDPLVGTWKLNAAASKYSPGPGPRSEVVTYQPAGQGVKYDVTRVDAAGANVALQGTLMYDGKDYPATGSPDWDAAMTHRVNTTTTETVRKRAGKHVQTVTRAISADGKKLTLTTKGTDARGRTINDVQVYDRQ
jgi:uncharacterized protein YcnI